MCAHLPRDTEVELDPSPFESSPPSLREPRCEMLYSIALRWLSTLLMFARRNCRLCVLREASVCSTVFRRCPTPQVDLDLPWSNSAAERSLAELDTPSGLFISLRELLADSSVLSDDWPRVLGRPFAPSGPACIRPVPRLMPDGNGGAIDVPADSLRSQYPRPVARDRSASERDFRTRSFFWKIKQQATAVHRMNPPKAAPATISTRLLISGAPVRALSSSSDACNDGARGDGDSGGGGGLIGGAKGGGMLGATNINGDRSCVALSRTSVGGEAASTPKLPILPLKFDAEDECPISTAKFASTWRG